MSLFYSPYSKTSILPPMSDLMGMAWMMKILPLIMNMNMGGMGMPQGTMGLTPTQPRMTQLWNLPGTTMQSSLFGLF